MIFAMCCTINVIDSLAIPILLKDVLVFLHHLRSYDLDLPARIEHQKALVYFARGAALLGFFLIVVGIIKIWNNYSKCKHIYTARQSECIESYLPCASSSKAINIASSPLNFVFKSFIKPFRLTRLFDSCACSLVRANGEANVWLMAKPNRNATEIKANLVTIFPIYKSFVTVE